MVTEMITMKLESGFLKEIDSVVGEEGYQNRTEFIRNALREKIEKSRLNKALLEIANLKGASSKKTSLKDYEIIRGTIFKELCKELR